MATRGRKKKVILTETELEQWSAFQANLKSNIQRIGQDNLTKKEKEIVSDFLENPKDDLFTCTQKMLRFKRYFLHKDLTQEECTYFVAVNSKGDLPTAKKRLHKMSICKIEARVMEKLRESLGKKMNIYKLSDCFGDEKARLPAKKVNSFDED